MTDRRRCLERSKSRLRCHERRRAGETEVRNGRATIVDVARAPACRSPRSLWCWAGAAWSPSRPESASRTRCRELGYIYHRGAATLRGRQIRRPRHGHQRPVEPLLRRTGDRHRAGLPGRGLHSVSRQHRARIRFASSRSSARCASTALPAWCSSPAIGTSLGELKALIAGLPVVQVMRRLPGLKASLVSPENREGARKATAHLIAAGHTRIAFVGGAQVDDRSRGASRRLSARPAKTPDFRSRVRWSSRR